MLIFYPRHFWEIFDGTGVTGVFRFDLFYPWHILDIFENSEDTDMGDNECINGVTGIEFFIPFSLLLFLTLLSLAYLVNS